MNRTIVLFILLLTVTSIFVFIRTENIEYHPNYFSNSISNIPEKIDYSVEISSNYSFSPLENFCTEKNMKLYYADDIGCIDNNGKIYHYDVSFKDDFWVIGNKTYKAIWS